MFWPHYERNNMLIFYVNNMLGKYVGHVIKNKNI